MFISFIYFRLTKYVVFFYVFSLLYLFKLKFISTSLVNLFLIFWFQDVFLFKILFFLCPLHL